MSPTTPTNAPAKPTVASLSARLDEQDARLDKHEERLDKYDAIIVRLDVLIDVLTKHVEQIDDKASAAIEGQGILRERNDGAHRWATIGIALASSVVVGVLCFVLGYVLH